MLNLFKSNKQSSFYSILKNAPQGAAFRDQCEFLIASTLPYKTNKDHKEQNLIPVGQKLKGGEHCDPITSAPKHSQWLRFPWQPDNQTRDHHRRMSWIALQAFLNPPALDPGWALNLASQGQLLPDNLKPSIHQKWNYPSNNPKPKTRIEILIKATTKAHFLSTEWHRLRRPLSFTVQAGQATMQVVNTKQGVSHRTGPPSSGNTRK